MDKNYTKNKMLKKEKILRFFPSFFIGYKINFSRSSEVGSRQFCAASFKRLFAIRLYIRSEKNTGKILRYPIKAYFPPKIFAIFVTASDFFK